MVKAFFVDFYGTVVYEDGEIVSKISDLIYKSGHVFELALKETGLNADEVIHIGDSISSDVKGASALGIRTLWLNRFDKVVPDGVEAITNLLEAFDKI